MYARICFYLAGILFFRLHFLMNHRSLFLLILTAYAPFLCPIFSYFIPHYVRFSVIHRYSTENDDMCRSDDQAVQLRQTDPVPTAINRTDDQKWLWLIHCGSHHPLLCTPKSYKSSEETWWGGFFFFGYTTAFTSLKVSFLFSFYFH